MRLLVPYILSSPDVDTYQIWLNTTDPADLEFLRHLDAHKRIELVEQPDGEVNGNASINAFFRGCTDPDALYIRFDDDIVWMAENTIPKLVQYRRKHKRPFLIMPMVVNNAHCTNILQNTGLLGDMPTVRAEAMDATGWKNPDFARSLHEKFLQAYAEDPTLKDWTTKPKPIANTRFSINCISWTGKRFQSFNGDVIGDEEEFLTVQKPQQLGLSNIILGDALLVHFAFFTQRDLLDRTKLLSRYASLLDECEWIDPDVKKLVDEAYVAAEQHAGKLIYPTPRTSHYNDIHRSNDGDNAVNTNNLNLPYLLPGQAQKYVSYNEAVQKLDTLVQLTVETGALTTPPAGPEEGARYLVGSDAEGEWDNLDGQVAVWQDGAWSFLKPEAGWMAWQKDAGHLSTWTGTEWVILPGTAIDGLQNQPFVGINTGATTSERFALASHASLFTHDGNDHRLKISKADDADTASIVFQTDFVGKAEIGATGDSQFRVKVSQDGLGWKTALRADDTSGHVTFPNGATFGNWTFAPQVNASGPPLTFRGHGLMTDGQLRFDIGIDNTAEAGSNSGSDFYINHFADDGSYLGSAFRINRATGTTNLNGGVALSTANMHAPSFANAELPDAAAKGPGAMIFVPDSSSGAILAYSDGTVWRSATTGQPLN